MSDAAREPMTADDFLVSEPRVFVEVLSRSADTFNLLKRDHAYRRIPSLRHYLLLEPDRPEALLWSRDADGDWSPEEITGLDGAINLTAIDVSLPMAEVYEDVDLTDETQLE